MDDSLRRLFELQAEIIKTMADAKRLMILHELRSGEMSVGQLASDLELPQSNVSRHLSVLRERGIVVTRREGTTVYYRLADERIVAACDLVRGVLRVNLARGQELASSLRSLTDNSGQI